MSSGRYEPHRGTLILILGILSLVFAGLILGPIAWILGNADMKKIRAGVMDPEGEQQTNIGRILGMVGTLLNVFACCIVLLVYGGLAAFFLANQDELMKQPLDRAPPPLERNEFNLPEEFKQLDKFKLPNEQLKE